VISIVFILIFHFNKNEQEKVALVYYKNELVKTIPLLEESQEYQVLGKNGIVTLESKQGKIRVKQENSPLHICSRQGFIQNSTEIIVCLPNQIVIKIKEKDNIDTIVR